MMKAFCIYLFVVARTTITAGLTLEDEVQGIRNLVKNLANNHTFPTCNDVLFTELADYETADAKTCI